MRATVMHCRAAERAWLCALPMEVRLCERLYRRPCSPAGLRFKVSHKGSAADCEQSAGSMEQRAWTLNLGSWAAVMCAPLGACRWAHTMLCRGLFLTPGSSIQMSCNVTPR